MTLLLAGWSLALAGEPAAVGNACSADPDGQAATAQWPPPGWLSDIPAVDLTGTWHFDPARSDPMIEVWQDRQVSYVIDQQSSHIVLEFTVEGGRSNTQTYRWDGTVHRFERGEAQVEELARWTGAGRALEAVGRWWLPSSPEEVRTYKFQYVAEGPALRFVQENDTGTTVWIFVRERE